jgi:hypothetical protein
MPNGNSSNACTPEGVDDTPQAIADTSLSPDDDMPLSCRSRTTAPAEDSIVKRRPFGAAIHPLQTAKKNRLCRSHCSRLDTRAHAGAEHPTTAGAG